MMLRLNLLRFRAGLQYLPALLVPLIGCHPGPLVLERSQPLHSSPRSLSVLAYTRAHESREPLLRDDRCRSLPDTTPILFRRSRPSPASTSGASTARPRWPPSKGATSPTSSAASTPAIVRTSPP